MGAPVTISTEEYRKLLEAQIRLDMVIQMVKDTDHRSFVDKDDLCRILGIKMNEEEKA